MKNLLLLCLTLLLTATSFSQKSESPYEWDWTRDGIWTGAGLLGSGVGLYLINQKDSITPTEFAKIEMDLANDEVNINFLDNWVVGKHDENANKISDIPFGISFIAPLAMLFDDEINDHTGQYIGIYIESLATTAALYSITAGLVDRSRPYVYDTSGVTGIDRRTSNNGQRSFYSGHVAATATATFFMAKAYCDFNPDANSTGKALIWTGAAVLPAAVGYYRLEAGQHFLTDVLLGYVLGAGTGILVPELHKRKNETGLSLYPSGGQTFNGDAYNGLGLKLEF